jgi:hypothetical protein
VYLVRTLPFQRRTANRFRTARRWIRSEGLALECLESRLALSAVTTAQADLPASVDLRPGFGGFNAIPYFQNYNDCVPSTIAAAVDYAILTGKNAGLIRSAGYLPSRAFLYYNGRFLGESSSVKVDPRTGRLVETPFTGDVGTITKQGLISVEQQGLTSEGAPTPPPLSARYPYGSSAEIIKRNPGAVNYLAARRVTITGFAEVNDTLDAVKTALDEGKPVVIGMDLPRNFPEEFPHNPPGTLPEIPLPNAQTDTGERGHAMLLMGYNDAAQSFIVLNSWGRDWGDAGYAYLPYGYVGLEYHNTRTDTTDKWITDYFTINGINVANAAPRTIGSLSGLNPGMCLDHSLGQVNIDTTAASSTGTATSFDFYNKAQEGQWVTPLLFSYDAADRTYTLTGIGQSFRPNGIGQQGIPFVPLQGTSSVSTDSAFGFFDGRYLTSKPQSKTAQVQVSGNRGTIPYATPVPGEPTSWVSTQTFTPAELTIGATFSVNAGAGEFRVGRLSGRGDYSAMLVE